MPETRQSRPKVVVTRELTDAVMELMEALFDATNNRADVPMTRDQLAEAMATCDVLVPTVTDVIDAGLIEGAGEQLRLIANYGPGIDHIALPAARARDTTVTPPPREIGHAHRRGRVCECVSTSVGAGTLKKQTH